MTLHAPQMIFLFLIVFDMCASIVKHGEYAEKHNAYLGVVGAAIQIALLYWGGFFK